MTHSQAEIIQFCVVFATAAWSGWLLFIIMPLLSEIRDILKKQKDSE